MEGNHYTTTIPSTIHHLEIKRLSNLLKHGGLQLLSIFSSTEKLVEIMIVSITDPLDDDVDNRKEGSKEGGGGGSYARIIDLKK